jgi:hypothetical protein
MKRRVRERVVGVSAEDDGEDVDGAGRELIGRCRWQARRRGRGQAGVTRSVSHQLSHEIRCASVSNFYSKASRCWLGD